MCPKGNTGTANKGGEQRSESSQLFSFCKSAVFKPSIDFCLNGYTFLNMTTTQLSKQKLTNILVTITVISFI